MPHPSAQFKDVFVVAFEPLFHHYVGNLVKRDTGGPGAYIEGGRGIILPMAVGSNDTLMPFHISQFPACSSLKGFTHTKSSFAVPGGCARIRDKRMVPVVSLWTVLGWMGNTPIEFVKIDIQGMDYYAVESAKDRVHLLQRIQVSLP